MIPRNSYSRSGTDTNVYFSEGTEGTRGGREGGGEAGAGAGASGEEGGRGRTGRLAASPQPTWSRIWFALIRVADWVASGRELQGPRDTVRDPRSSAATIHFVCPETYAFPK